MSEDQLVRGLHRVSHDCTQILREHVGRVAADSSPLGGGWPLGHHRAGAREDRSGHSGANARLLLLPFRLDRNPVCPLVRLPLVRENCFVASPIGRGYSSGTGYCRTVQFQTDRLSHRR